MYISECLKKYLPKVEFEVIEEEEVCTLGILASRCEDKICSFIDDIKYIEEIPEHVRMLFVTSSIYDMIKKKDRGYLIVKNPRATFFHLHNALKDDKKYGRKEFSTQIDKSAQISPMSVIAPTNVIIGKNVIIEPFVVIYENTVIGDNCIVRSGVKIGGKGLEFKREADEIFAVEHLGGVILERNVEILDNSCIARGIYPWDNTIIGEYTKIDNLTFVSHGARIGKCCMIVGQVGIGGRTIIGDYVWIGFGATLRNGIEIGDNARINMGSIVTKNVQKSESVTGNFAIPHELFMKHLKNSLKEEI